MPRIRPISDLRNNAAEISDFCRQTREPVYITRNGSGDMVVLNLEEYERQINNYGKFYARLPLGESPYDVAIRVHQFMGTIYRDYEKHGVDTLFVFTHGTTLRAFLLRYFHYTPEWFHEEHNPKNCWIREIKDHVDYGYINK